MKAQDLRNQFLNYFIKHKHQKIPSSSLVPENDPTLLFANAGMNQFKDYFTGKSNAEIKRAISIQKCVRAGGKHNDLENVGNTARHHTFFEMLGNFSFGDYFKREAIEYAWEFLTSVLKIPGNKLYATVHHTDDEGYKIWKDKIGLPLDRIFKKGDKDNFWEMADHGPCGPCSEIFYDHGEKYSTPNFQPKEGQDILGDEQRYVEIWNLVFMQYEKKPEGLFQLPNPCIDTGSGFERVLAILQGKYWNYDTDLFRPIIRKIENFTGKEYSNEPYASSIRIVADHIRTCSMLITDGVIPSNEGRGYVLRRIIRRAVRHLKKLNAPVGSLHKLVPTFFQTMSNEYPQNEKNSPLAIKLLQVEEEKFLETLDLGLKYLDEAIKKELINNVLPGKSAFKLYDTFGFPIDLTESILQEKKISIDLKTFQEHMQKRKEESKKTWKGGRGIDNSIYHNIKEKFHKSIIKEPFVRNRHKIKAKLLHYENIENVKILIFNKTPFYGESGGQIGDSGKVLLNNKVVANIYDTQRPIEDLYVHFCDINDGKDLKKNKEYELHINEEKRQLTARNHTATHLLQAALIKVLGNHIKQAGSLVSDTKLRFDFTHMQALTKEEINHVETQVNQLINSSLPVNTEVMAHEKALKSNALAFFGDKYSDMVRVLYIGKSLKNNYSIEFCGGTHIENTADIQLFTITSEESLSTGVRRIEAITSKGAIDYLSNRSKILKQIEIILNSKNETAIKRLENSLNNSKKLEKEIKNLKEKIQSLESERIFSNPEKLQDNLIFKSAQAPDGSDLRKLSDIFINKHPNGILLLHSNKKGKTMVLLRVDKKNKSIDCSKILNQGLKTFQGRCGGRPDMAQGSGELTNFDEFEKIIKNLINENLS